MGAKLLKTIPSFQGHDGWVDARETVLVERGFFFSFFFKSDYWHSWKRTLRSLIIFLKLALCGCY